MKVRNLYKAVLLLLFSSILVLAVSFGFIQIFAQTDSEGTLVERELTPLLEGTPAIQLNGSQVSGAESEQVIQLSNKEITIDIHPWRFAPLYWVAEVQPEGTYTFRLRYKIFNGEGETHIPAKNFNEYGFLFLIGNYDLFTANENYLAEVAPVKTLNDLTSYIEGEVMDALNGEWVTVEFCLNIPKTYMIEGVPGAPAEPQEVDSLVILTRPEAAAGADNTRTLFVDKMSISGYEKEEEIPDGVFVEKNFIAQTAGSEAEILEGKDVPGAESENVIQLSNKRITPEMQQWRFAPLFWTVDVQPGVEYIFSMRFRIFNGEGTSHIQAINFNEYGFFLYAANRNQFGINENNTVSISSAVTLNDIKKYAEGNAAEALNGQWTTVELKLTMPQTYTVNGVEYPIDTMVVLTRPEAAAGADNTRTLYVDKMSVSGYETEEELPEEQLLNLAADNKYWKSGINDDRFLWSEEGMSFCEEASLSLYDKVGGNSVVSLTIEGNYPHNWGNFYIVFKDKNERPFAGVAKMDDPKGTFAALQIGGDGLFIIECINGVVEKMPCIAVNNLDIWYFYAQRTDITFEMKDTENCMEAVITISGPNATTVIEYSTLGKELCGDGYFSIACYLPTVSDENIYLNLMSLTVSGVTEFTAPDPIDVAAVNSQMAELKDEKITHQNYAAMRENLDAIWKLYDKMNYPMIQGFDSQTFDHLCQSIALYEKEVERVQEIIQKIELLPDKISKDNLEEAKEAVESTWSMFDALSEEGKQLVSNQIRLRETEEAIVAYEAGSVAALIASLPDIITESNIEEVKNLLASAKDAYQNLSEEAQNLVQEAKRITETEEKIAAWETMWKEPLQQEQGCAGTLLFSYSYFAVIVSIIAIVGFVLLRFKKDN